MSPNEFWSIIEKVAHLKQVEKHKQLISELSRYSVEDICRFDMILGHYISFAESPVSWFLCKLITGYASDDGELYFRLWLVSLGKDRFLGALKNPDSILEQGIQGEEHEFEALMSVSYDVLSEKVDDIDSLWEKYSLTDEEVSQVGAEVELAHFDWFKDSEDLLSQAKICAPKLYTYYKKTQENRH